MPITRVSGVLAFCCWLAALAPQSAEAQTRPDLASRDRLRVCAAPTDLPFSNKAKEGFENKIAEIVADELKRPLHYFWMPQGPGFIHNTINMDMCDVIIGYAAEADIVDHSNAYYASTYALVARKGGPLDGVTRLEDPRLKAAKLGVIAATPPVDHLLRLQLLEKAHIYNLMVDRRFDSPAEDAIHDVIAGDIDAAILWGPIGGYFAQKSPTPLVASPLMEDQRPALTFRIAFGIRHQEPEWKHLLNDVIRKRRGDIEAVLKSYGVPVVPIQAAPAETPANNPESSAAGKN